MSPISIIIKWLSGVRLVELKFRGEALESFFTFGYPFSYPVPFSSPKRL